MSKNNIQIALVGNPNSGKTSLFNSLTGLRQQVGNFPGVTVDKKQALQNSMKPVRPLLSICPVHIVYIPKGPMNG